DSNNLTTSGAPSRSTASTKSRARLPHCRAASAIVSPQIAAGDCNLTMLASITDQPPVQVRCAAPIPGLRAARQGAGGNGLASGSLATPTPKAPGRRVGTSQVLVQRGGMRWKKRFPLAAKTLMVAPLCLGKVIYI